MYQYQTDVLDGKRDREGLSSQAETNNIKEGKCNVMLESSKTSFHNQFCLLPKVSGNA